MISKFMAAKNIRNFLGLLFAVILIAPRIGLYILLWVLRILFLILTIISTYTIMLLSFPDSLSFMDYLDEI
jgi:hypothetical protein